MARGLLASSAPLHDNRGSRRQRRSGEGSHRGIDCALLNCRDLINIVRLRVRPSAVSRPKSWREQKIDGLFLSVNDAPRLFVRGFEKLLDQRSARQTTTRSGRDSGRSPASAPRGSTLHAMPNPFASSGPLSPAVGANPATQRRNPFASSAPLVGDGGPHGHAAPPPTGPPPTTFSGGFTQPTQQTPPYGQGMYPTPPEMRGTPTMGVVQVGGAQMLGAQIGQYGQPAPVIQGNFGSSGSLHSWEGSNIGHNSGLPQQSGFNNPGHQQQTPTLFVPAATASPGISTPSMMTPAAMTPSNLGVPSSVTGSGAGLPTGMPTGVPSGMPSGTTPIQPIAAPISLRGRERYCSGGAWVGPAPEWPKPPAGATVVNADVSGVLPKHMPIVQHIRGKHGSLMASASGSKKRELESLDNKLGGMLVFLNAGEGETHLSAPVADALLNLCLAANAHDVQNVNAYLLHISTHYWEEVSYWFPALKRLMRL